MIRLASVADSAAIAAVQVLSWRETYAQIIPDSYLAKLTISNRTSIWQNILEKSSRTFAYDHGGKIIGFASVGLHRDNVPSYFGELYAIYLLKAFHKKGIGRQLFQAAVEKLHSEQLLPFTTWVLADNPTLNFYTHVGGKIIGERMEDFDGVSLKELQLGWA